MKYYHDLITKKSFKVLQGLKKDFDLVLIGGWAVWLYTQALKSKDIDLILNFDQLEKLRRKYDLVKNSRLKKYETKIEDISIDIYLPFYSDLGLPVEKMIKKTTIVNGFDMLEKEMLLITKLKAYQDRRASVKGQKDLIDIISLVLLEDFDFKYLSDLIKQYHLEKYLHVLEKLVLETKEIPELNLNQHAFSKRKKKLLETVRSYQVTR